MAVSRAVRAVAVSPGGADHRKVLAGCSTPTFLSILPNWGSLQAIEGFIPCVTEYPDLKTFPNPEVCQDIL